MEDKTEWEGEEAYKAICKDILKSTIRMSISIAATEIQMMCGTEVHSFSKLVRYVNLSGFLITRDDTES